MKGRPKQRKRTNQPAQTPPPKAQPRHFWIALCAFVFLVLVFYWKPLMSPNATQQWDTIDYKRDTAMGHHRLQLLRPEIRERGAQIIQTSALE